MTIIKEITNEEILITTIWIIIFVLLLILVFLPSFIKDKIHSSYHKGYNERRNDEINYYETLRELNDDFNSLLKKIKNSGLLFEIDLISNLTDYSNKIRKFKNKN